MQIAIMTIFQRVLPFTEVLNMKPRRRRLTMTLNAGHEKRKGLSFLPDLASWLQFELGIVF